MSAGKTFAVLLLCFARVCIAQIHEEVTVPLVEVDVSVLDSKGNPVLDLSHDDFILKENGRQQQISHFARLLDPESTIPLTILFLVDNSGSMKQGLNKSRRIDVAKEFALLALKEVKANDVMQVFGFDVVFKALTPMTSNPVVIDEALSRVEPDTGSNAGTAFLFSVEQAINVLEPLNGRKVMILCSDGENTVPGPNANDLLQSLKRAEITVLALGTMNIGSGGPLNTISLPSTAAGGNLPFAGPLDPLALSGGGSPGSEKAKRLLKTLAEDTGGYAFFPEEMQELNNAVVRLRSVLRSQYVLAFTPSREAMGWRKINVTCKRKGVKLRYRSGYFND